nr:small ubiquitin-related modifier 3 isoform X2 [Pan troglodytes]
MSEEKPKEGVKTENDHINLKVAGQDGSVVQFKIKRHTPLSKLMKAYCERQDAERLRALLPAALLKAKVMVVTAPRPHAAFLSVPHWHTTCSLLRTS